MADKLRPATEANAPAAAGEPASDNPMKRYRPARSDYRSRSHRSAHDSAGGAAGAPHPQVPVHPLIPRGEAEMIDTPGGLKALVARLRGAERFAYDSEFIGELTYVPKLCLIQVASAESVSLIDPLAKMDLSPFWEVLCDGAIEKVVHAGSQDLEPVFRHMKRAPANVFDTQIACGFIGMAYPVALGKMVREIVGVPLGKGLTFTHWDQRPLSAMQLRYAADDVRYLIAARDQIGRRLEALGHAAWAAEECRMLCEPRLYQFDPDHQYRRVRGATSLNPAGLAILRELVIWRDGAARAHDLPPRAFLKDEILLDLARNPVKSVEKLARIKGLPRPVELAHGGEMVEAIARAAAIPHAQLPTTKQREETPMEKFRADSLWTATEAICFGRGIDPNLVASRQEIGVLYRHLTAGEKVGEGDVRMLEGWRRAAVGEAIIGMVKGGVAARMGWESGALRTIVSGE
jgi:ribonuclease D